MGSDESDPFVLHTRRQFLINTAAAIAAMHGPLQAAAFGNTVPNPQVRLRHIRIRANNLEEQREYYRDVLQLPVEDTVGGGLRVTAGESMLEFVVDEAHPGAYYHFAFTIPENQLEAAMVWLEPRCPITVLNPRGDTVMHFKNWNAHSCYFADPAGNILEFIAHHDLQNRVSGPFASSRIERISEIGVVVPDVPAFEARANQAMGLAPYRGSSPVFSPIGDVGGLLIVVKTGRKWFGTDNLPAVVFPTDVHIESPGPEVHLDVPGHPYTIRRLPA